MTRLSIRSAVSAAVLLTAFTATAGWRQAPAHNTLTPEEKRAGWQLLFDGVSTNGWRGYQTDSLPTEWRAVDGVLTKVRTTNDIVTVGQYADFEFMMDWKVAVNGNAGLFYRATEKESKVYWSAHEYQLFTDDTTRGDGRNPLRSAGAVYDFYPAPRGIVKPADTWNTTKVIAKGTHVEHWLNGVQIASFELFSPEWEAKFKTSKFYANYKDYAKSMIGRISIQGDHNGVLQLRNIKIRELR